MLRRYRRSVLSKNGLLIATNSLILLVSIHTEKKMNGAYGNFSDLGGLIIWTCKLFKGKFKDHRENKYSFMIGVVFILVLILILFLMD